MMGWVVPPRVNLEVVSAPDEADERFVREQLYVYNRQHVKHDNYQRLDVFLRDAQGNLVGGLLGGTYWDWLVIDILWIDERVRGQGHGTALLMAAEEEAAKRGCRRAHVDTHDFQARPFYEKHGYVVWGVLEDLPPGHSRFYLRKDFHQPKDVTDPA